MFSLRLPIPLVKTPPSPSCYYSHYYHYRYRYRCYHPFHHRSQTQSLIVSKPGSAIAKCHADSVTLRDDGVSLAQESLEPLPAELAAEMMPKHVAVIMDGNGRWAKVKGLPPSAGHQAGVQSLRKMVRLCCSWGIKVLTVFAFSTDNWVRPKVILVFPCFQVQLHYRCGVASKKKKVNIFAE